jgi:hypothetical protein
VFRSSSLKNCSNNNSVFNYVLRNEGNTVYAEILSSFLVKLLWMNPVHVDRQYPSPEFLVDLTRKHISFHTDKQDLILNFMCS